MSPRPRWPYRRRRERIDELPPEFVEPPPPEATAPMPVAPPGPLGPPLPPEEPPPSRELWPWLLLLAVVVLGGLAILWAVSRDDGKKATTTTVVAETVVPAVTGLPEQDAVARIDQAGLRSAIIRQRSSRPSGIVLAVRPPAGTSLSRGSVVRLVVSSGAPSPSTVPVPSVIGLTSARAARALTAAGLRAQTRTAFSARPANTVIAQDPAAGANVVKNSIVSLTVSKGEQQVAVPNVVGATEADARSALRAAGLLANVFQVPSSRPEGTVVAQNPRAGERVAKGSRVRVNISRGPTKTAVTVTTATTVTATTATTTAPPTTTTTTTAPPTTTATAPPPARLTTVPDVRGQDLRAARRTIRRAGLLAAVVYIRSREPADAVLAQFPRPGAQARRGARVRINVSLGPAPRVQATIPDVTGLDEATARAQLEQAGFVAEPFDQETSDPSEDGVVLAQDPGGGTRAPRDSPVTIYIGRYTG